MTTLLLFFSNAFPNTLSDFPSPYPGAVSKKFIPFSMDVLTASIESLSSWYPHKSPPANGQHPRANSETLIFVVPSF